MKIGNITIKFHFSILILIFLVIWRSWSLFASPLLGIVAGGLLTIMILSMVLLHEMAHVKAAQWQGYHTDHIMLWGLGGYAQIPGLANITPKKELIISIAGPLSNIALAIITFFVAQLVGVDVFAINNIYILYIPFVITYLFWLNVLMGIFNMIPAFPMDGGRVARATLSIFMPSLKATKIAVYIAKAFSILFVVGGFYTASFLLPLIGFYIWYVSSAELKNKQKGYYE